uniref:Maturase K n=1 Tax=Plectus sambesii TaxID=2011161 RepID=A0A914WQK6_9BILA
MERRVFMRNEIRLPETIWIFNDLKDLCNRIRFFMSEPLIDLWYAVMLRNEEGAERERFLALYLVDQLRLRHWHITQSVHFETRDNQNVLLSIGKF